MPLHVSNVALYNPDRLKKADRVGFQACLKTVRKCVSSSPTAKWLGHKERHGAFAGLLQKTVVQLKLTQEVSVTSRSMEVPRITKITLNMGVG
jgi:ribosomal protein L5